MSEEKKIEVQVYNTATSKRNTFKTNAVVFGELIQDMVESGISFDSKKMKAIIGESRLSLESMEAQLPKENFKLFLFPKETKSGVRTRIECFAIIGKHKGEFKDAKAYYGNQTQVSTENLNKLIDENPFDKKAKSSAKEEVKENETVKKTETIKKIEKVEEVKTVKELSEEEKAKLYQEYLENKLKSEDVEYSITGYFQDMLDDDGVEYDSFEEFFNPSEEMGDDDESEAEAIHKSLL